MKKLLILLLFLCVNVSASVVVMDTDSGRILYSKDMNNKKLIASTTKIMTSIIALENAELYESYVVGEEIKNVNGSMIYVNQGEIITLEDLLYGLLLQSGNDAAEVIATNVLGYSKFINKMNEKANSLGMLNTTFENPHGLNDDTKNYSTAYDLALLMKYALKNKDFIKISSARKYKTKSSERDYIWYNKNKLLSMYKYTISGKIGYTKASGQVFVSSARKDDKNLIIVSIDESDKFNLHKNLYEKYFDLYNSYKILDNFLFSFKYNKYKNYYLYIKNDIKLLLNDEEKNKVNVKLKMNNEIKDDVFGTLNVYINDKLILKENVYGVKYEDKINKIKSILYFWK